MAATLPLAHAACNKLPRSRCVHGRLCQHGAVRGIPVPYIRAVPACTLCVHCDDGVWFMCMHACGVYMHAYIWGIRALVHASVVCVQGIHGVCARMHACIRGTRACVLGVVSLLACVHVFSFIVRCMCMHSCLWCLCNYVCMHAGGVCDGVYACHPCIGMYEVCLHHFIMHLWRHGVCGCIHVLHVCAVYVRACMRVVCACMHACCMCVHACVLYVRACMHVVCVRMHACCVCGHACVLYVRACMRVVCARMHA